MKRILSVWAVLLCVAIQVPAQGVYIYTNSGNPIRVTDNKLYYKEANGKYYLTNGDIEVDNSKYYCGSYKAVAQSMFDGYPDEEWYVTITPDANDETKVWIAPIFSWQGLGYSNEEIYGVYGIVDEAECTITIPLGQEVYYNVFLVATKDDVVYDTGDIVVKYQPGDSLLNITFDNPIGAYTYGENGNGAGFYQFLQNVVYEQQSVYVKEKHPDLCVLASNVDSISTTKPVLRVTNVLSSEGVPEIGVYFNYYLEFLSRLHDKKVKYTAYDVNNKVVVEDYIDSYTTYGPSYVSFGLYGVDQPVSYFIPDDFLPCDTTFKVALSIEPGAIRMEGDSTVTYSVDSYIDADGTEHGLIVDYYNERGRLLSFERNETNHRELVMKFSKYIYNNGFPFRGYKIYKADESTVTPVYEFDVMNVTTEHAYDSLLYFRSGNDNDLKMGLPDCIELERETRYIVTIDTRPGGSYAGLIDNCWCRVESIESGYIDDNGNPAGLAWEIYLPKNSYAELVAQLEGTYIAQATSLFDNKIEEWEVTITSDPIELNKIRIHPVMLFGGLDGSSISPIYATVDTTTHTIDIPLGQQLFYVPGMYDMRMAEAEGTGTPSMQHSILCSYAINDGVVTITFLSTSDDFIGIGVGDFLNNQWWYQAISYPTLVKGETDVEPALLPLRLDCKKPRKALRRNIMGE